MVLLLPAMGQQPQERDAKPVKTRILFVFDASQSMVGRWKTDRKYKIATRLFANILDSISSTPNLELALRLYGHQVNYPPGDCQDTRLEVPFAKNNIGEIKRVLKHITPRGTTPIAYSLSEAASDFPPCDHCRNIIVLITDGIEECSGDPCAVSAELQQKGIILKPFIVGIGKSFREQFECVGTYYDARDETEFREALKVIISQVLNPTTLQVNLLDAWGAATETNVNMTFYDHETGKIRYNLIHAMNNKGLPDTLEVDPHGVYDIVVHTIPPVYIDSVILTQGIHNAVGVDAPQGYLNFQTASGGSIKNLLCLIRKKGEHEILNVQPFDQTEKYITGNYSAEILCLPRLKIDDINIRQNHTTTVEIPSPGLVVIQTSTNGFGSIYQEKDGELFLIYNMEDTQAHQTTLYLQPGEYRVVFRSKFVNKAFYTLERAFTIRSGQTTNVKLYGK